MCREIIEPMINRVCSDTHRLYFELSDRPAKRIGAMLLQGVPVLAVVLMLLYLLYSLPPSRTGHSPFLEPEVIVLFAYLVIIAVFISGWLIRVVCIDIIRLCTTCRDGSTPE